MENIIGHHSFASGIIFKFTPLRFIQQAQLKIAANRTCGDGTTTILEKNSDNKDAKTSSQKCAGFFKYRIMFEV